MKQSIKRFSVILATVICLISTQNAFALTVEGAIDSISTKPNIVVVEGIQIYKIRFDYLCNQYNICLELGDDVSIEYYEYECSSGTIINKACSISVDDVTVQINECL
jgi:hypothetical protein